MHSEWNKAHVVLSGIETVFLDFYLWIYNWLTLHQALKTKEQKHIGSILAVFIKKKIVLFMFLIENFNFYIKIKN